MSLRGCFCELKLLLAWSTFSVVALEIIIRIFFETSRYMCTVDSEKETRQRRSNNPHITRFHKLRRHQMDGLTHAVVQLGLVESKRRARSLTTYYVASGGC